MSAGSKVAQDEPAMVGTCATCGRPLTQVGPKGECLRCLADLGFVRDSQEPEESGTGRRLAPGPLKYDHFEVEIGPDGFPVELGAGAMAITYRAHDIVLNSIVALKVIDRRVAQNSGARSRFLREARAAAQIHHSNVARVSHYGEQDGECFYVMELVEGQTLEAKVRREGPMPLALALEVIEQVARALAAAEACGVVHRDIKPSNIMLESDAAGTLVVKVIDYGVAKVLAPEGVAVEQTQTGFIGTPAFASPEQFDLSQKIIDTRSDIYSLGATFWYLLSGRVPFVGRTMEDIHRRQTERLPLEQLKGLHIPSRCLALLKSMLAPDPNDRPQSARELLSRVHGCFAKFSSQARARKRRVVLATAAATLIVAAVALAAWLYQRAQSASARERSIAVLPFENLNPNGEDNYFVVGMQNEITSDLAHLAGLKVIGSQSTRSYAPGRERNLRAIGGDLGVRHLLEGTISRTNDQLRIVIHLVDLRDSTHPWGATYERQTKDLFTLQSEITRAVAARLQTRLSPNEKKAVDTPPTSDLHAYELYLQARSVPSVNRATPSTQYLADAKQAIQLLEQSTTRDPDFVLAYCELARWHDELFFRRKVGPPEENTIDHRELSEAALEKARRLQPDSGVVHLALARHALQINNNVEEAEIQVRLARRALPNNAQIETLAGRVARRMDQWDESLRCFEKAVSLEPRDLTLRVLLADTYRFVRRYDEYDRVWGAMTALMPADKLGTIPIQRAYGPLEKSADLKPFHDAIAAQIAAHQLDEVDTAWSQMALAFWSHDADGISRVLSRKPPPIAWNGVTYPTAWFEALAARIRGDDGAAAKAFAIARAEMEKDVTANPTDGLHLSVLAMIDAGLGRKEQAVQEAMQATELTPYKKNNFSAVTVNCHLAVVYAWIGQNDLAIAKLTEMVERPANGVGIAQPTYGDFRLNPLWDPLRNDPRFEAVVQKLAPVASR